MRVNMRGENRGASTKMYSICWRDASGCVHSDNAEGVDVSPSGLGVKCRIELAIGSTVRVEELRGRLSGDCTVRHCSKHGNTYLIGLEQGDETKRTSAEALPNRADYYAFLQINPNAEAETIHRVYRFLASRFHPDNPETGDPEKFLVLKRAFETLSDPELRAAYDASLARRTATPLTTVESVDFLDGIEGEINRRLAVLSILYERRRVNADRPLVSLAELENQMGFPREYLDFTTWYLKGKKYITKEDNSDFALTALGVDYVEANYSSTPALKKLLAAVSDASSAVTPLQGHELRAVEESHSRSSTDIFVGGSETERKRINRKH
jgi:DnaJ domain